ncbi:porin [Alphaproteobacteria bacterium]|nr:porin [Alphaproteobacteria bacterium]
MRKVLLATTALVAVGGITAANAADISISGNYEWEYTQSDTGSAFGDDGHINIKGVIAADNGMTFTAMTVFGGGSDRTTGGTITGAAGGTATGGTGIGIEENYIQVDGDFGSVILGDVDGNGASSLMDGALGRNKDIETQGGLGSQATHGGTADTAIFLAGGADIIYMSPKVGGLQIGLGADLTDADAVASDGAMDMAVTYSMAGVNLFMSGTSGQAFDKSNYGVSTTLAGLTIAIGSMSESGTNAGVRSAAKSNDVGLQYTLPGGIKLAALSAKGTGRDGTTKIEASNFGASYSIVPGVKLNAESGVFTKNNVDKNYTWIAVNMSF